MKAQPGGEQANVTISRPRLAIVVSHPIQHFCPMYRDIARDGRVELLVIFAERGAEPTYDADFLRVTQWQPDLLEGVPHVIIHTPGDNGSGNMRNRTAAVLERLRLFAPQVVYVHGYALPYLRKAMDWARSAKVKVMMCSDSELKGPRSLRKRIPKRLLLPGILRKVDLFLTVGDANEEHFLAYGVSRAKFLRAPFSIDSDRYDRAIADRARLRRDLRAKLCIPEDHVVLLNVGKLTAIKSQDYLIRAFAGALAIAKTPATLILAGDGPERARLQALAETLTDTHIDKLDPTPNGTPGDRVRLLGFIDVTELPAHYLATDLYVHPSRIDPHPLAISEATYCSLPIVASSHVGSAGPTDDLQQGRNGWVHPYGDESALTAILVRLIDDATLRASASAASGAIGEVHASHYVAARYIEAVLRLTGQAAV